MKMENRHKYHLVEESPWPIMGSVVSFEMIIGVVGYLQNIKGGGLGMILGLIGVIIVMIVWWRDVIREATFMGCHTSVVQRGLRYGMIFFIMSEVLFFFAFFWAYFHSSVVPVVEIGAIWPPVGIDILDVWGIPLVNTVILVVSGISLTMAHHALIEKNRQEFIVGFEITVILALFFTEFQVLEYLEAAFSISDGIYGSCFFIATGFHGLHVIIGTIFIIVCGIRHNKMHFNSKHHFGFEAAAWYWHFVDVVWLFLFLSIYWWGSI